VPVGGVDGLACYGHGCRVAFDTGQPFIRGRENKFMMYLGQATDVAVSDTAQPAPAMAAAAG
jgi:hypothetical protein